jgi:transposase
MGLGRETKLTPATQKTICDAIAAGNYDYVAAEYAGVGRSTFFAWLAKGEQAQTGIHRDFLDAVKRAGSQAEVRNISIIELDGSWQSKAWWLERKFHDRWGRKETIKQDLVITGHLTVGEIAKSMVEEDGHSDG